MRALTIRQPHASLVAVGAKTIETRPRSTSYRGPLLIHAGKAEPAAVPGYSVFDWASDGWTLAPIADSDDASLRAHLFGTPLPLGAVVASCQLIDCVKITDDDGPGRGPQDPHCVVVGRYGDRARLYREAGAVPGDDVTDQLPFGDFSPGRYAWLLDDVKPTTGRCPRCWGGEIRCTGFHGTDDEPAPCWGRIECGTCGDTNVSDPVPMRGRQGLWTPTDDDWAVAA